MNHKVQKIASRNVEDKKMVHVWKRQHRYENNDMQREGWLLFDKPKLFPFCMQDILEIKKHAFNK